MKNILIYTITSLIFFAGCKSNLEEIRPQQDIDESAAFADEAGAVGATIGIYGLAQDLEVLGSMPQIIAEFQSDNVNFIGSFPTLQEIKSYNTLANNSSIETIWIENYETITAANAVIANIPKVPSTGFTAGERAQLIGEAKFLRALVMFNMVNLFAHPFQVSGGSNPGIPLVTEPFEGEVVLYPRATVNDVHSQIRQDLEDAISSLAGSGLGNTRANEAAARTLLARLHLYREEWTDAAVQANFVVSAPANYPPATNLAFYNAGTPEDLFSLTNTAIDNGATGSGGWDLYFEPANKGGRGDCPFSVNLISAYSPGDARFALSELGANGMRYTTKYNDAVNNSSDYGVLRVSEAYLIRAEALAQSGGLVTQEIVDLLNMTRTRAGLTAFVTSDFANVAQLLDAIYLERRFEFAFEGHRRMDLLRTRTGLRPVGDPFATDAAFGADKTILPIPQGQRDLDVELVQNMGY